MPNGLTIRQGKNALPQCCPSRQVAYIAHQIDSQQQIAAMISRGSHSEAILSDMPAGAAPGETIYSPLALRRRAMQSAAPLCCDIHALQLALRSLPGAGGRQAAAYEPAAAGVRGAYHISSLVDCPPCVLGHLQA